MTSTAHTTSDKSIAITDVIGKLPYRMAFAGGWIDQPFVSRHNPSPPGSMVVIAIEPICRFMGRCGMIGLIYPGINRLDYDYAHEGGRFPAHIESNNDPAVARWLEEVIYMVPIAQRPPGYNPLGKKNLDPTWIQRLGQTGRACYDAIVATDLAGLGRSMNECMQCWEVILPHTVRHETIHLDLMSILGYYQTRYAGAMYSGCGGGYIYVASEEPVPGGFQVQIRIDQQWQGI
jgi:hypothetical protein